MQVVNIRQLKSNPSTALRSAKEDDMVVVMNRDHPEALLISLDKLELPDPAAVRVALAVSLFRNGAISAGFAARMAGKPLPDMLTLLSSLGIPLTDSNAAEISNDMATARQWLDPTSLSPTPDR
jgi:predicted HTH domain antitoxin